MRPVLGLGLALMVGVGCVADESMDHAGHDMDYAGQLLRLSAADHRDRAALSGSPMTDAEAAAALAASDSARTAALEELVAEHGWPTTGQVGSAAVEAFFVLVQHTPSDAFRDRSRPHLTRLAEDGEVSRPDVAMHLDRLLVDQGDPQRFGTQFRMRAGRLEARPIADLSALADLREKWGLPPMAEYVAALEKAYGAPVVWPLEEPS